MFKSNILCLILTIGSFIFTNGSSKSEYSNEICPTADNCFVIDSYGDIHQTTPVFNIERFTSNAGPPQLTLDNKNLIFKSKIGKSGIRMNNYTDFQIKNEPMFFHSSYEFALKNGGPITQDFLSKLPLKYKNNSLIDSRSHMLMKGFWPCIPGWHHDDVPRSLSNGQPDYHSKHNKAKFIMALVNSHISPTQFIDGDIELPDVTEYI